MRTPDRANGLSDREESVLATVDRALAGGGSEEADPELRDIERLALELRDDVEAPAAEWAAALDRRVADGFPGSSRPRRRSQRPGRAAPADFEGSARPRGRRWLAPPVLAGVASVALALALAAPLLLPAGNAPVGLLETDRPDVSDDTGSAGPAVRSQGESSSPIAPESLSAPVEPRTRDELAPGRAERLIERAASLSLAAPEERLEPVADAIVRIVDRRRGFVLSSSVTTGQDADGGGSFDLRVPVAVLEPALRELSALGQVRARSQSGQDVTASAATVGDRLDGARAERRALLRRLEGADSPGAIRALRRQLDLTSGEVRGLQGELRRLRERTDYATVSVSLSSDSSSGVTGPPGPVGEGWSDLLRTLAEAVGLGLRALGVLVPLGVVAVPVWLGARALRRRRREAVLS